MQKNQKSKYDKMRIELDAAISKSNSLKGKKGKEQKLHEAEGDAWTKRTMFEQTGKQTIVTLKDTITLAETEMLDAMCQYLEIYRDHFIKANRFLTELIPEMDEYKRYVDTQNESLKKSKTAINNATVLQEKLEKEKEKEKKKHTLKRERIKR